MRIVDRILSDPRAAELKVLDVGAGDGKWSGHLYNKVGKMDAIEIWSGNITRYDLESKYDVFYLMDAVDFQNFDFYDVVILGDVLEHLKHGRAIKLVGKLKQAGQGTIYLTIPISLCLQDGKAWGNPYETHLFQWTHEEIEALGFAQIHEGYNGNGLVKIGTYEMRMSDA